MGQRSHREHDIRAVEIWLSIHIKVQIGLPGSHV